MSPRELEVLEARRLYTVTVSEVTYTFDYDDQISTIAIGDFDGDGRPDIAAASLVSNSIRFFFGNSAGRLDTDNPVSVDTNSPVSLLAVDFNGDGRSELLGLSQQGTLSIFSLNGQGQPALMQSFANDPRHAKRLISGDFDGDDQMDVALIGLDSANRQRAAVLFEQNGALVPAPTALRARGGGSLGMTAALAADVNGDGRDDIVTVDDQGRLLVFRGKADRGFADAGTTLVTTDVAGLAAGDFDGDGRADLALGHWRTGTIDILEPRRGGRLRGIGRLVCQRVSNVATADIDANGSPDIIGLTFPGYTDEIYFNTRGDFETTSQTIYTGTGIKTSDLWAADLDGNGMADLIKVSGQYYSAAIVVEYVSE